MGTKMKGLLKGLRYISQIFDPKEEEEPEMQIGLPTDVKHVAHIGFDGSSVGFSPSWMKDIKPAEEAPNTSSPTRQSHRDSAAPLSTSSSGGSGASRHQRRHQSNKTAANCASNDSPRASRKSKHKTGNAVESVPGGGESPGGHQEEGSVVPKQRRRKPKTGMSSGGSSEGSTRSSSRSKGKGDGSLKHAAIDEENGL